LKKKYDRARFFIYEKLEKFRFYYYAGGIPVGILDASEIKRGKFEVDEEKIKKSMHTWRLSDKLRGSEFMKK
jgi:hypothetical protein